MQSRYECSLLTLLEDIEVTLEKLSAFCFFISKSLDCPDVCAALPGCLSHLTSELLNLFLNFPLLAAEDIVPDKDDRNSSESHQSKLPADHKHNDDIHDDQENSPNYHRNISGHRVLHNGDVVVQTAYFKGFRKILYLLKSPDLLTSKNGTSMYITF